MATPKQIQELLDGPAMKAPLGATHNFVDPESIFVWYIVTTALCVTASSLSILIRVYTKLFIVRKFGADDLTAVLGYLLWIGYCVPTGVIMRKGGGIHQWDVHLKDFITLLRYSNVAVVLFGFAMFFTKVSILLQYLRIFVPTGSRNKLFWTVHVMIGLHFMYYTAISFAEIFLCTPRQKYWNVLIRDGHCGSQFAVTTVTEAFNAFSDIVILLLPQGVIWKLQMPLKKKIAISAVFLMGFFVCVCAVFCLYYAITLVRTGDVSYNIARWGYWTYAELSTGVVCACLPVLPRFFQTMGQKLPSLMISKQSIRTMIRNLGFIRLSAEESNQSVTTGAGDSQGRFKQWVALQEHKKGNNKIFSSADGDDIREGDHHILKTVCIESYQTPAEDTEQDLATPWQTHH